MNTLKRWWNNWIPEESLWIRVFFPVICLYCSGVLALGAVSLFLYFALGIQWPN